MTYRIRIESLPEADTQVSVDKVIEEDVLRVVLVSMMQMEEYKAKMRAYAHSGDKHDL